MWFFYQKAKVNKPKCQTKIVLETLDSFFENQSKYPTATELEVLAEETNRDIIYIRNWFRRKRYDTKIK
jgi:hypothetical protein